MPVLHFRSLDPSALSFILNQKISKTADRSVSHSGVFLSPSVTRGAASEKEGKKRKKEKRVSTSEVLLSVP